MKRLATLVLTAGFIFGSLVMTGQGASATPFSDVPANHWAYQAIQSLAADGLVEGYPDGKFKGDRPMTRYEMAVLVARVIAKVQAGMPRDYATKADLDKLQKLIDAFKDELDALGVRVTNLEDSLDALDKRTKFAQSIEFHGFMQPQVTLRQRYTLPRQVNLTSAGAGGANLPATPYTAIDNAYISSDFTNSAYTQNGASNVLRWDDRFVFVYHVNDNLTVSIPVHLQSSTYGGEFAGYAGGGQGFSGNGDQIGIQPGVDITIAKTGAITNLLLKWGIQDNIKASRTGLAYKPPDISQQATFETPQLAFQKGFSVTGTLNGLTDFQAFWTRVDPNMLNTQTVLNNTYAFGFNSFLFNINPGQIGYSQNGYPGVGGSASQTLTFNAGAGPLTMVYLTNKALIGTVFISAYNGTLYNSAGQIIGGGTIAAPAFVFDDALNAVTFNTPLPAGSTVSITFVALSGQNYNLPVRFDIGGRVNQRIKGIPGAELGFTFNRIFDVDDLQCTGALCSVQSGSPFGYGLVSDTVFGLDAQLPLGFNLSGANSQPVLFGEIVNSKFTPDFRNVAAISDNAWVGGVNLKIGKANGTFQYQSIGANFISGAPFRYYGNPPATFAYWKLPYFPAFYGFMNTLGLNTQFDTQFGGTGRVSSTATSTTLTYMTPLFNPFIAGGPQWFSSFSPNTQGVSGNVNLPFTIGDLSFAGRVAGAHLTEIRPNSVAAMQYGPGFSSNVKETFDRLEGAVNFTVPVFRQRLALGLGLQWDRLQRLDNTSFQYYPFNPNTGGNDPAAVANALAAFPAAGAGTYASGSQVSWQPNWINVQHWTTNITAALPVTRGITLTGLYNQQTFGGAYQSTFNNMDERKIFAVGGITYAIPNSPSTVSFTFRNQKYQDNVVPSFNLNQTREDLTYSIRF
jgi:hypothetical protein